MNLVILSRHHGERRLGPREGVLVRRTRHGSIGLASGVGAWGIVGLASKTIICRLVDSDAKSYVLRYFLTKPE